jgi:MFS family permease
LIFAIGKRILVRGGQTTEAALTSSKSPSTPSLAGLILLCAAGLLAGLDFMIMNVALPAIQDDLGLSAGALQWVISAYALAFGGLLLLGGRLADLLGPRRMFIVGFAVFAVASLLGGLVIDRVARRAEASS